ncbi:hypothetical protein BC830DRAFT_1165839 [Chytriomyces sp. MP71]|nr:hypothetical protein BC830DRAFT_1165839 [Chytriomyces sp. MP71]
MEHPVSLSLVLASEAASSVSKSLLATTMYEAVRARSYEGLSVDTQSWVDGTYNELEVNDWTVEPDDEVHVEGPGPEKISTSVGMEEEFAYALEVGQFLLDQNRSLEFAVAQAKEETDVLLSLLAQIDPDLVEQAMANMSGDGSSVVAEQLVAKSATLPRNTNSSAPTTTLGRVQTDLRIAHSQIEELKEQVETLTTRNTELRLQNMELRLESQESITVLQLDSSPAAVSRHVADLENRVSEYDILVNQLKGQLESFKQQNLQLKLELQHAQYANGLKTPVDSTPPHLRSESPLLIRNSHQQNPSSSMSTNSSLISPVNRGSYGNTDGSTVNATSASYLPNMMGSLTLDLTSHQQQDAKMVHYQGQQQPRQQPSTTSKAAADCDGHSLTRLAKGKKVEYSDWGMDTRSQVSAAVDLKVLLRNPVPQGAFNMMDAMRVGALSKEMGMMTVQHVTTHVEHPELTTSPAVIATNVNVIVRLMVGAYLDKYNRHRTKVEKRFVNVNPYSRTISWSKSEPGLRGMDEVTTVYMQTVYVEDLTDGRSRIVISAPGREVVFQCGSAIEHVICERGFNPNFTKSKQDLDTSIAIFMIANLCLAIYVSYLKYACIQ